MTTFEIRKGVFAMGTIGKRASNVVKLVGGNYVGVRGQRPLLEKGRFKKAKTNAALRAALKGN